MPSNKSWLPPSIQRFIDWFNFAGISPAAEGIHRETRTLKDKITAEHAVVKDQPVRFMEIHAGEAKLIGLLTRMLARQPHDEEHPMKVLDIGTFTGQSALAMAENLPEDGKVIACDIEYPENSPKRKWLDIAKRYWRQAGVDKRIEVHLAKKPEDTLKTLATQDAGTFDLVFIDANKEAYDQYYEKALELLKPGGLVILDNMLWSKQVPDLRHNDPDTVRLRTLNEKIRVDSRVRRTLLEVEDGIIIAEKLRDGPFADRIEKWNGRRTRAA